MSQGNPRVFVTQESQNANYGPAEAFGEIVFLTRDEPSPVPNSLVNIDLMSELRNKLQDFDFEHDFIAPSGSPVVCGLAFLILGEINAHNAFDKLCVLRWSNRDRVYQPIQFKLI